MKNRNTDTHQASAYNKPGTVMRSWSVREDMAGLRSDLFLVKTVRRISRTKAQKIIRLGDFRSEEQSLKPSKKLRPGQNVELWRFPPDSPPNDIRTMGVHIIYQDDYIVIVNKPPDLVVHPTARYLYRTLTYWLKQNFPNNTPKPCHRIDRETSGILVCARKKNVESYLKQQFQKNRVEKSYLAIVEGRLEEDITADIPLSLQGNRGLVKIRMIPDPNGKKATTHFHPFLHDHKTGRTLVFLPTHNRPAAPDPRSSE